MGNSLPSVTRTWGLLASRGLSAAKQTTRLLGKVI